jgi:TonB family protein
MNVRTFALAVTCALAVLSQHASAQAYWAPRGANEQSSAVDSKGVRHYSRKYSGMPPWANDLIQGYSPPYPVEDRARRHQGIGLFRLRLDLNTGAVSKVEMLKSTGFSTLDGSAITTFRRWRWKPGKWKEIEMPITFHISSDQQVPPGAIRLQPRW